MINDTFDIDCLVQAIENVMDAAREHDAARDEYTENGGYSWGYYGQRFIQRKEEAALELKNRLDAYIVKKVQQMIAESM